MTYSCNNVAISVMTPNLKEAWKLPATAIPWVKLSITFANKLRSPTVFVVFKKKLNQLLIWVRVQLIQLTFIEFKKDFGSFECLLSMELLLMSKWLLVGSAVSSSSSGNSFSRLKNANTPIKSHTPLIMVWFLLLRTCRVKVSGSRWRKTSASSVPAAKATKHLNVGDLTKWLIKWVKGYLTFFITESCLILGALM